MYGGQAVSSPLLECQRNVHWEELDWKINDSSRTQKDLAASEVALHSITRTAQRGTEPLWTRRDFPPRFHWNGKQVWWLPFFLKSWTVEYETFKQTHVLQRDDLFMTINWISFDPNVACHTTANSPLEQLFTNTFRKADSVFRVTSFKPNLVFHSFWLYFL